MNKPFFSRRSYRKQNFNYALPGYYFVTILVHNNLMALGKVTQGSMELSPPGQNAQDSWDQMSAQYATVSSESFVVMPNHVHGIIRINPEGSSILLGELIRSFKGRSTKFIHAEGFIDFKWQRNYYDRIIRTERELRLTQLYIATNPVLWKIDPENKEHTARKSSENLSLFKQCGFTEDDMALIEDYVEYRRSR